jgi:two-component system, OmpR family, alkaline phosphatase synthesis response regulator PhoP
MANILVVDDNPDLAFGLRSKLEVEGYTVHVAGDGPDGLESARTLRPDLIILDLMLKGMSGFQVLRTLRAEGRRNPVMVLTAKDEEADKVIALRSGADDYVTKPFGVLELLARVEAILRRTVGAAVSESRSKPATDTVLASAGWGASGDLRSVCFGDVEVRLAARSVVRGGDEVSLKPKEFDLLLALMGRKGAAASRLTLMREVWGQRAPVASRTVDTHIFELRRKLEVKPRDPEHILTVHRIGYRFRA